MDNDKLAIAISIVALISSFVSPVLTAWFNGHYRIKEKKLDYVNDDNARDYEFYIVHRAEVIEKFLKASGKAIEGKDYKYLADFGDVCGEIYLYLDESYWDDIDYIINTIDAKKFPSALERLQKFAKDVSRENIRFAKIQQSIK